MATPDTTWGWAFLEDARAELIEGSVWPSIVSIIDRLLTREQKVPVEKLLKEITRAAATLHDCEHLLDAVLRGLMIVQSDEFRDVNHKRDQIETLNDAVAVKMHELADAIERRNELSHEYDLHAPEAVSILGAIDAGLEAARSETRLRGREYVWPALEALAARFDGKYWPTVPECLRGLAGCQNDAGEGAYRALRLSMMGYETRKVRAIGGLLEIVDDAADKLPARRRLRPAAIAAALNAVGHDEITADNVRKNPVRRIKQKNGKTTPKNF